MLVAFPYCPGTQGLRGADWDLLPQPHLPVSVPSFLVGAGSSAGWWVTQTGLDRTQDPAQMLVGCGSALLFPLTPSSSLDQF